MILGERHAGRSSGEERGKNLFLKINVFGNKEKNLVPGKIGS